MTVIDTASVPPIPPAEIASLLVSRAGWTVSTAELQAAADAFRRRLGLESAERTREWLAAQGLSLREFEAALERRLVSVRLTATEMADAPIFQEQVGQPTRPWIGQQEGWDCGLAALAMIARAQGRELSLAAVRRCLGVGREGQGVSLRELQRVAGELGLPCRAVRVEAGRLGEVPLPIIAHLTRNHYVIVYEHQEQGVVVGDPAVGLVRWSREQFARAYSGRLLVFLGAPVRQEGHDSKPPLAPSSGEELFPAEEPPGRR